MEDGRLEMTPSVFTSESVVEVASLTGTFGGKELIAVWRLSVVSEAGASKAPISTLFVFPRTLRKPVPRWSYVGGSPVMGSAASALQPMSIAGLLGIRADCQSRPPVVLWAVGVEARVEAD